MKPLTVEPTLVSVEHRGKHYYTTDVDFTKGVNLSKYPNQRDEPRLRPTVKGNLDFGEVNWNHLVFVAVNTLFMEK